MSNYAADFWDDISTEGAGMPNPVKGLLCTCNVTKLDLIYLGDWSGKYELIRKHFNISKLFFIYIYNPKLVTHSLEY